MSETDSTTPDGIQDPVRVDEVVALVRYASTNGLDPEGRVLKRLYPLVARVQPTPGMLDDAHRQEMLVQYAALARLTFPVTGKTLIDSDRLDYHIRWIRRSCYAVLFILAVSTALKLWLDEPLPENTEILGLQYARLVMDFMNPFLWGALGSYVYLLKRFSDFAADRIFDEDLVQGWGTRVILGTILGGVVQYVYDSNGFAQPGLRLDASAWGFLAGVGVKVVYGAIEKTIDALGSAMNLGALRTATAENSSVRRYLNEQLASLGTDEESKKAMIAAMLADLQDMRQQR